MTADHIALTVFFVAALCSGCVAFNIGEPKAFTHSETVFVTESTPFRTDVISVKGWQEQHKNNIVVGLMAYADEEFVRNCHKETYSIREQRRLAIGLYPGGGEIFLMPEGALKSSVFYDESNARETGMESLHDPGQYLAFQSLGMIATIGIPHALCTVYSLFAAPFDGWECHHDMLVKDISDEKALRKFSLNELDYLNSNTRSHRSLEWLEPFSHCGLIGCHKYTALFVESPQKDPPMFAGTETRQRDVAIEGPFIAELSIPSLNHSDWKRVQKHETQTTFILPDVRQDCTVEAFVSFHEDDIAYSRTASDLTRQAIAKATGGKWRFNLSLKAYDRAGSPPHGLSLHSVTSYSSKSQRIATITSNDGWFYDHDSRCGWVKLCIPDGMPIEDARHWVRENISTILAEKDVLLEADKAPPSGVTYRSLGEKFENGILTVEFEAVQ